MNDKRNFEYIISFEERILLDLKKKDIAAIVQSEAEKLSNGITDLDYFHEGLWHIVCTFKNYKLDMKLFESYFVTTSLKYIDDRNIISTLKFLYTNDGISFDYFKPKYDKVMQRIESDLLDKQIARAKIEITPRILKQLKDNKKVILRGEYDAYSDELLEIAQKQHTKKDQRLLLKKSIEINPNNFLSHANVILLEADPEKRVKRLEKLKIKCQAFVTEESRIEGEFDEYQGFWGDITSRDYMRICHLLYNDYILTLNFEKALEYCEYLLNINPSDNQGFRFKLNFTKVLANKDNAITEFNQIHDEKAVLSVITNLIYTYTYDNDNYDKMFSNIDKNINLYLEKLSQVKDNYLPLIFYPETPISKQFSDMCKEDLYWLEFLRNYSKLWYTK